jgi:hypothetical protein
MLLAVSGLRFREYAHWKVIGLVDLQTISIAVAAASVIVGVIFSLFSIRNIGRSRQASLFSAFQSQAYDKQFVKDMTDINEFWSWDSAEDFFAKYGPEADADAFATFVTVGMYYDGMGRLLREKLIDKRLIPEFLIVAIVHFGRKIERDSRKMEEMFGSPLAFDNIEYLYREVQKMQETRRR